jgi:hypothetical protein
MTRRLHGFNATTVDFNLHDKSAPATNEHRGNPVIPIRPSMDNFMLHMQQIIVHGHAPIFRTRFKAHTACELGRAACLSDGRQVPSAPTGRPLARQACLPRSARRRQ